MKTNRMLCVLLLTVWPLATNVLAAGPAQPLSPQEQYLKACQIFATVPAPTDFSEAVALLKAAAEGGNVEAANRLGYVYDNGVGVPSDDAVARYWFEKAASGGLARAQFNFGRFLLLGLGGKADPERAIELLTAAADGGVLQAQSTMGEIFYFGQYQQKIDYSRAFPFVLAAARQGHPDSQQLVGLMYSLGRGVKLNRESAAEWYKKSADQGNGKAQLCLGQVYLTGTGIKLDKEEAIMYLTLAAYQGEAAAEKTLEALRVDLDPALFQKAENRARNFRVQKE